MSQFVSATGSPFRLYDIGCPTFRGFRKVGTTGLDTVFTRSFRPVLGSGARTLLPHETPETMVRGAHPCTKRKDGAASVVTVTARRNRRWASPLWYTPYLTTMFYLSAIPAGLAVTIMAIYLCVRSLNVRVDMSILSDVSKVIAPLLAMWGVFRFVDLISRDATPYLWMWREETGLFWLEIALLVVIPVILLNRSKVRENPQYLYGTCAVVVMGFITNRLNVSVTALQASSGVYYVPKWTEFAATLATIAAAVVAFHYAIVYLDIFAQEPSTAKVDRVQRSRKSLKLWFCGRKPRENQPGVFVLCSGLLVPFSLGGP